MPGTSDLGGAGELGKVDEEKDREKDAKDDGALRVRSVLLPGVEGEYADEET